MQMASVRAVSIEVTMVVALVAPPVTAQEIDSLRLETHARVLSADSMEGRASGSAGQRAAAAYIVSRLEAIGIPGFAPGGGYLQPIPLTSVTVQADSTRLIVRVADRTVDTIASTEFHHLGGDRRSFAPFAGAGVYAGTTIEAVESKVVEDLDEPTVLVVRAHPAVSIDSLIARLDTSRVRAIVALVRDTMFYHRLRVARGPTRFIAPVGAGRLTMPVLVASPTLAERLGIDSATASGTRPGSHLTLETAVRFAPSLAGNIVARLPGRRDGGPAVLYLAHYDHIGIAEPEAADSIYNGFIDNAVGTAAVLEIARAMAESPPAGAVIFLFPAAEEEGSLGSAWFAERPPLPRDSIAAAINLDAGAPLAPPRRWRLEGGSAHDVWHAADSVARSLGGTARLVPALANSDHWSLLSRGVPSVLLAFDDGWEGVTPEQEEALIARWWRAHRPNDEWAPGFPLAGLHRYAEFAMWLGYAISEASSLR